ncbi:hypothetical protein J6590_042443 [Homalodisca vitripennis]|nr:hypothetical protein J6590_042443 [Homalodisca vitripennis]
MEVSNPINGKEKDNSFPRELLDKGRYQETIDRHSQGRRWKFIRVHRMVNSEGNLSETVHLDRRTQNTDDGLAGWQWPMAKRSVVELWA